MIRERKITIGIRSPVWKSCLQRSFAEMDISWALDIDGLLEDVVRGDVRSAIVELTADSIVADCRKVYLTAQLRPQTRFFAVGDRDLNSWLPLIRACGFADCCPNLGRLPKMVSRIYRHYETCPGDDLTIEERVMSGLPWKPVRQ